MTDTYSPSDVDVAVKISEFSLDRSPFLLGVARSHLEDIETFLLLASKDILDYYSHMTVLEFFLKDLHEESEHAHQSWEIAVGNTYSYFVELFLEKINEVIDKDVEIVGLSFLEPSSFVFMCKEKQKTYGSFKFKKKGRGFNSGRKRHFRRY